MALLHLTARLRPSAVQAATVDHQLRPEAAGEAQLVAQTCATLNVPHDTLVWSGWDQRGNLQDAARQARRDLLAEWARAKGLSTVLLGHTRDDQAETVLMRLARGSGVDGLSGMRPAFVQADVTFLRPLLCVGRADLRDWLSERGIRWIEDPSNDDEGFDRIKARRLLAAGADMGLSVDRLVETADRMALARAALSDQADRLLASAVRVDWGDILVDRQRFGEAPDEIRYRVLAHLLCARSGQGYRPRFRALKELAEKVSAEQGGTLHGCLVTCEGPSIRIGRDYAAVRDLRAKPGDLWDGRWRLNGPVGTVVAALGQAAFGPLPNDRPDLPRATLQSSPALWDGETLLAAPLAGLNAACECHLEWTLPHVPDALAH